MELNNILGSLTQNTDKLGMIIGVVANPPHGLSDLQDVLANIGHAHMPDFMGTFSEYLGSEQFRTAAMAYVAGLIVDELNPPFIGKYGNAIKKFGVGYGAGTLVAKILWKATH